MKHILMIPLPAFSHITPLMELARKLVSRQQRVTVLVPQYLKEDIRIKLAADDETSEHVQVRMLEDGYVQDPAYGRNTIPNLQPMCMMYIPKLLELMGTTIEKADGKNVDSPDAVDVVIVDSQFCPMALPAFGKNIPVYFFNTASAEGVHLKGLYYDDNCPLYENREADFPLWKASQDGMQPLPLAEKAMFSYLQKIFPLAQGLIVSSVHEFEQSTLQEMQQFAVMKDKKVFMVGPLIPAEKVIDEQDTVRMWLDGQTKQSVIYIAFGSAVAPSSDQLRELGKGLLATGQPFIFALSGELQTHLPTELQAGAGDKFLLLKWAPQRMILEHRATGLFISHCGWNSTLESLVAGVPVLGWPLFAEQGINARMLAKHGVAVVVEGTGLAAQRVIPAQEIVDMIRKMNVGGNLELQEACGKLMRVFKEAVAVDGSSSRALNQLSNQLLNSSQSL